ncbi:CoA pyrophosphatase [Intrasporangium sp. YIM S08009]|uniref:NUDIX hydrolase n=1 Tax=Intrasporangium zincisolvens TaxID=3080018 RepID=UPI002B05997D|nr:CoA pyrophosphatase [Intrasporangium sp. YIM S08009]
MTQVASGIAYAGRTGTIEPAPLPEGGIARPGWVDHLADRLGTVRAEDFSLFVPPDEGGRESAVLILFGPPPAVLATPDASAPSDASPLTGASAGPDVVEEDVHVVLLERSHDMRSHPAQIAFPGGARDPEDADDVATALREAQEETGLDPSGVDVVATLPSLFIPFSGFVVTPVLGWWARPSALSVRDPNEVHDVLSVPVSHLVAPATRFSVTHPSGYVGPGFGLDDLLLWGFTAGLLGRVLDLAGLEQPWDASVHRPLPERYVGGGRG